VSLAPIGGHVKSGKSVESCQTGLGIESRAIKVC
jgi:hypothetical protein